MKINIGDKFIFKKDNHRYMSKGTVIKIINYYSNNWWEGEIINKERQFTGWDLSEDYLVKNFVKFNSKIKKIT